MHRRDFLRLGVGAAIGGGIVRKGVGSRLPERPKGCCAQTTPDPFSLQFEASPPPPAFSVIPVVGDGKWVWTQPPKDQTGYLEPRPYSLSVGIELRGQGNAKQIKATTTVPMDCPEQKIVEERIEAQGCEAHVRQLGPFARQLCLVAPQIAPKQTISAVAHYKLTVSKQYHKYERDQFPEQQSIPNDVRKVYLGESPGIQTRSKEVKKLLGELSGQAKHPWELAQQFAAWIPRNIRPQIGSYTSVTAAIENHLGDCEEMAAVFVALCRASGIPARLVWIPNHNWAEFYLVDKEGKGHWIPAHTACYFWFGWTGVHELVLQKGDRTLVPERGRYFRLLEDWVQWGGRRPEVKYTAELTPEPPKTGEDAGPGARRKDTSGDWKLVGTHTLDRYARR